MTWLLRPGVGVARREAGLLQLGVDPPGVAVLPDTAAVRTLLTELAHGAPLRALDPEAARALARLVGADLVVAADAEAARVSHRGACVVSLDVPAAVLSAARRLVEAGGLRCASGLDPATVAVVWAEREVSRDRADDWMRSGTPHLVVRETPAGPVLGPYVVPGATACLRCVDAHAAEADPRRALVVEQLAARAPLRPADPDPVRRALTLSWLVHDLVTAAEGAVPTTWSATVALRAGPPVITTYLRHLHCGCCWAADPADDATGAVARAG